VSAGQVTGRLAIAFLTGALLVTQPTLARAQAPAITLRVATPAPDGTRWAGLIREFMRQVETTTGGTLRLKMVWGGIAGDDVQVAERVARGQLDAVLSGGMLCEQLAPTHRALRLTGVYRDYDEVNSVAGQLRGSIEKEARAHGYVYLADMNLGVVDLFSRAPLRTLDEIRTARLWMWNLDTVGIEQYREMGLHLVELPLDQAGPAYLAGQHDGFIAIPGAMLAYQWGAHTRFITELHVSYLVGCVLVANRAFDRLTGEQQQALRLAAAQIRVRTDAAIVEEDAKVIAGAFGKQGTRTVPVSAELRNQVEKEAKAAINRLGDKLIPRRLFLEVLQLVDDYRMSHTQRAGAVP
jgi:TRAP-type C4-dicarboxylate transport system substrate-binding protein